MKIAFFAPRFPVISETFILNQITGLIDRGHNVEIFTSEVVNDQVCHPDVKKYRLLEKTIQIGGSGLGLPDRKMTRLIKALKLLLTSPRQHWRLLWQSIDANRFGKEAASLSLFYRAHFFLNRDNDYDILHCHFGNYGRLIAQIKAVGALHGKLFVTFHGTDITKVVRDHGEDIYKELFRCGDMFLPISHHWKNRLVELGCDKKKIKVHRMGINLTDRTFQLKRNDGPLNLLTVARLVEKKGIEYALLALANLVKKYDSFSYRIIGDGPLRSRLEEMIQSSGLGENVQLLGWRDQDEVGRFMAESDLLIAPSVTSEDGDQEGLPVVLMEALAHGLPVLSTYHSGIPELIETGVTGFLVPERNADALAETLEFILTHQEKCSEVARTGRVKVEAEYDIEKLNDRLVEVFAGV